AAQRLHEQNAGNEPLTANHSEFLFVIQQSLLGIDDIKIVDQAPDVAAGGNVQSAASGVDRFFLRVVSLIQNRQASHVVLDFAKSVQDSVPVRSDARVVTGLGKLCLRVPRATREDSLGGVGPDSPEGALHIQKLGDVRRLPSAIGKEIQRRKVGRASDANLGVGHGHL